MKKHPAGKFFFFPFVVVHVCFGTICLYLQDFNFVYYYACFLLNNSYFFSLIFQLCFWFLFIFRGYRRRSIQQASLFPFCCYACLLHYSFDYLGMLEFSNYDVIVLVFGFLGFVGVVFFFIIF